MQEKAKQRTGLGRERMAQPWDSPFIVTLSYKGKKIPCHAFQLLGKREGHAWLRETHVDKLNIPRCPYPFLIYVN